MFERTEETALAGRLSILVGGEAVELRTLNLDESETWLSKVGAAIAGFDLPSGLDAAETFDVIARTPTRVMLELVRAYDVDGTLPEESELRTRFSQRELYAALRQQVTAEAPFVTDVRSVAAEFGPAIRSGVAAIVADLAARSRPASSTNGHSPNGVSIPELSVVGSPSSDSSSSGGTDKSGSRARRASSR